MKSFFTTLLVILIIAAIGVGGYYYYHKKMGKVVFHESDRILQALQEGNKRFVAGRPSTTSTRNSSKRPLGT